MIGLQRLAIPSCPLAKCPPAKCPLFSLVTPSGECVSHQSSVTLTLYTKQQTLFSKAPADLPAVIVVFIDILPNWGWFSIIKQICHGSVGILMECLPSGGWFSFGLCLPPSWRHSIRIPTLPWHICLTAIWQAEQNPYLACSSRNVFWQSPRNVTQLS